MRTSQSNPWLAAGLGVVPLAAVLIAVFIPSIARYILAGVFALAGTFGFLRFSISVFQSQPRAEMRWSKDGSLPMSRLSRLLMACVFAVVGVYCFIRFSPLHTLDTHFLLLALAILVALVLVTRWLDMRRHKSSEYAKRVV